MEWYKRDVNNCYGMCNEDRTLDFSPSEPEPELELEHGPVMMFATILPS